MNVRPVPLSQLLAASAESGFGMSPSERPITPNCVLYSFPPEMDMFQSLSHAFSLENGKNLKTADSRRIRHRLTEIKSKLLDPVDAREEIACSSVQWTDLMHEMYSTSGYFGIVKYDARGGKGSSAEIWQAYLNKEGGHVHYTEKEKRHGVAKALVQKNVVIMAMRLSRNGTIYCSLVTEDTNLFRVHSQETGPLAERPKLSNPWVETAKKKKQRIQEMSGKTPQDYKHLWRTSIPIKSTDSQFRETAISGLESQQLQEDERRRKRKAENRKPTDHDVIIILSDSEDDLIITEPPQKKRKVEKTAVTQRLMNLLGDDM
mmetsp:Transcript_8379/g.31008  ORF Transcript_8379/g.31008 Transcript_8379/m.31008 type:complete len:318 (-) Transcript_8379:1769-2722(-)